MVFPEPRVNWNFVKDWNTVYCRKKKAFFVSDTRNWLKIGVHFAVVISYDKVYTKNMLHVLINAHPLIFKLP